MQNIPNVKVLVLVVVKTESCGICSGIQHSFQRAVDFKIFGDTAPLANESLRILKLLQLSLCHNLNHLIYIDAYMFSVPSDTEYHY